MKPKPTDKAICYAVRQPEEGRGTRMVADELGVTQRHIQRLRAEHLRAGKVHEQRPAGRPAGHCPSEQEISAVMEVHHRKPEGVIRTATKLRKEGRGTSRHKGYKIMKSKCLVEDSPAKSRRRGWAGHERICPNAMRHTDWHAMKDPRMKGIGMIACLGDASGSRTNSGACTS